MEMKKIKVSIVIPIWNSQRDLPGLLKSLLAQKLTGINLTVILSDNGSKDKSVELARKLYPGVLIVRNNNNRGRKQQGHRKSPFPWKRGNHRLKC